MRSNCLFWALRQRLLYGGSLGIGRSEHPLLPCFWWVSPIGDKFYFAPLYPKSGWRALLHALRFEGEVRRAH